MGTYPLISLGILYPFGIERLCSHLYHRRAVKIRNHKFKFERI